MDTSATPTPPPQRYPSWKQVLVILLGGLVLAVTSCVGFLVSLGGNFERGGDDFFTPLAAILFCVGVLAVLVGLVMLLIRIIGGAKDRTPPPAANTPH